MGDGGHLPATAEWSNGDATSRIAPAPGRHRLPEGPPGITVDDPVQRWGNLDLEILATWRVDAALPLGTFGEVYALRTYAK